MREVFEGIESHATKRNSEGGVGACGGANVGGRTASARARAYSCNRKGDGGVDGSRDADGLYESDLACSLVNWGGDVGVCAGGEVFDYEGVCICCGLGVCRSFSWCDQGVGASCVTDCEANGGTDTTIS